MPCLPRTKLPLFAAFEAVLKLLSQPDDTNAKQIGLATSMSFSQGLVFFLWPLELLTDYIVHGRVICARQEVREEVDHDQALLFSLKKTQ